MSWRVDSDSWTVGFLEMEPPYERMKQTAKEGPYFLIPGEKELNPESPDFPPPLYQAVTDEEEYPNKERLVLELLNAGANLFPKDRVWVPLIGATLLGEKNLSIIKLLLLFQADPLANDGFGGNAYDFGKDDPKILEVFEKAIQQLHPQLDLKKVAEDSEKKFQAAKEMLEELKEYK